MPRPVANGFYRALKARSWRFNPGTITSQFASVDPARVEARAEDLSAYISTNLPRAFERRNGLKVYRTNPYVLMTSASIMKLGNAGRFAEFLFNSKPYMALETSF